MSADLDLSDLFDDGDPFAEPPTLPEMLAGDPRPRNGFVLCSLAWLARIRLATLTPTHLIVALLVYSECLRCRTRTVGLPNSKLRLLGISRYAKYRALTWLQSFGVLSVEPRNGRAVRVTLHWFP
jgi:hypothetical protein